VKISAQVDVLLNHAAKVVNDGMDMDFFFPSIKIDASHLKDSDLKVAWSTILV
jgi:hypothetical protein